jgi:hypothetical protein
LRAAGGVDQAELPKFSEHAREMRRRLGPVGAFEPVLIEERGKTGLPQLDFPQYAEQRRQRFLALAFNPKHNGRGTLGGRAMSGFRSGAETEIDEAAPSRWRDLEMRDFMQQDIGLGCAAQGVTVPSEVQRRAAIANSHPEKGGEREGGGVIRVGFGALGALRAARVCDAGKDAPLRLVQLCGKAAEHAREFCRLDRGQDHARGREARIVEREKFIVLSLYNRYLVTDLNVDCATFLAGLSWPPILPQCNAEGDAATKAAMARLTRQKPPMMTRTLAMKNADSLDYL